MAALLATTFVLFAIIGRVLLQLYTTGNHGIRLADPTLDPTAAVAGSTFSLSFAVSLIIVGLDFYGIWHIPRIDSAYLNIIALVVGLLGVAVVVVAQLQMGSAWRIGVDPSEKTGLVTKGLFKNSRNPIYFGLGVYWVALSVLLPHPVIWLLAALCWTSIEFIVRRVEEPYLKTLHGSVFEHYKQNSNRYNIWRKRRA